MTHHTMLRHGAGASRRDPSAHAYAIGQAVHLSDGFGRPVPPGALYEITGTLPANGGAPQYRIRSDDERHERVATQDALRPADLQGTGPATLIERTFSRG